MPYEVHISILLLTLHFFVVNSFELFFFFFFFFFFSANDNENANLFIDFDYLLFSVTLNANLAKDNTFFMQRIR